MWLLYLFVSTFLFIIFWTIKSRFLNRFWFDFFTEIHKFVFSFFNWPGLVKQNKKVYLSLHLLFFVLFLLVSVIIDVLFGHDFGRSNFYIFIILCILNWISKIFLSVSWWKDWKYWSKNIDLQDLETITLKIKKESFFLNYSKLDSSNLSVLKNNKVYWINNKILNIIKMTNKKVLKSINLDKKIKYLDMAIKKTAYIIWFYFFDPQVDTFLFLYKSKEIDLNEYIKIILANLLIGFE